MLTMDASWLYPTGEPSAALLSALLAAHEKNRVRLDNLREVYQRKHRINGRVRLKGLPNNRLSHDLPGYIATMAAGYLGSVQYVPQEKEGFAFVREAMAAASSDSVDAELAVDAAVYGKGVEICYADSLARPRVAQVSPCDAFVAYDDTVEHLPLLGVAVSEILDQNLKKKGERVTVYTRCEIIGYERKGKEAPREVSREPHFFGGVPLVEYWNNSREEGDFEAVMGLIDAYDALQSDRVNDKQQFTDSILALYGVGGLGTDEEADGESDEEKAREGLTPSQRLRQTKTLFMPADGARAEWLVKPLAEGDTEILRKSLKDDIHKLCMVPDLTDEHFSGNVSGVAMRFKLLYALKQEIRQRDAGSIDKTADGLIDALSNRYQAMLDAETERLDASRKAWQDWRDDSVKAIQGQIDALDELSKTEDREKQDQEELRKIAKLRQDIEFEQDDLCCRGCMSNSLQIRHSSYSIRSETWGGKYPKLAQSWLRPV